MMDDNTIPIPDWGLDGLLPLVLGDLHSSSRWSPYPVSLTDVITRFGSTDERRDLLRGLLDFRAGLHHAGLTSGFQWIDGSFVENIEAIKGRSPADIDVVTFFRIPDGQTQESIMGNFPNLFDRFAMKREFGVDSYLLSLGHATIEDIRYWRDLWSHTRDRQAKGYLHVELDASEDESARAEVDRMNRANGGQP